MPAFAASTKAPKNMVKASICTAPRSARSHLMLSVMSHAKMTSKPHHAARKKSGRGCSIRHSGKAGVATLLLKTTCRSPPQTPCAAHQIWARNAR